MDIKKAIVPIVLIIISIIVILTFVGSSASTIVDGGTTITTANSCASNTGTNGEALTFNLTNYNCDNSSDFGVATYDDRLPLNVLFGGSGVLILILMAGILILIIGLVLKRGLKQ